MDNETGVGEFKPTEAQKNFLDKAKGTLHENGIDNFEEQYVSQNGCSHFKVTVGKLEFYIYEDGEAGISNSERVRKWLILYFPKIDWRYERVDFPDQETLEIKFLKDLEEALSLSLK